MKSYFFECFRNPILIFSFFIALNCFGIDFLNSEESYLKEMEIDSSTKFDENNSDLPTNPFEIVEMIRRATSMNDATKPSDAIDDALKSFNMDDVKEKL